MQIQNNAAEPLTLVDWDFTFLNAIPLSVTTDEKAGDTVTWGDTTVKIYIAPRPIPGDQEQTFPARHLTVFLQHLLAYETKTRVVMPLTLEQQEELAGFANSPARK